MLYNIAIYLYMLAVMVVSPFHKKARQIVVGHWNTFRILRHKVVKGERYVWFHAASLGEFEQGRPLMERIRREHPDRKILLTFFSPSGYEVRKNYDGADVVCYLPFDTPGNVASFFRLVKPEMAIFIKYEFWKNFIRACHRRGIPVYSVSSIFRPSQIFFHRVGYNYRHTLNHIDHFFVQNEESRRLLAGIGIKCVTVTGDMRFDRVLDIRDAAKPLPLIEKFAEGGRPVLVAGSSWEPDEALIIPYFNSHPHLRLILAPHVVSASHLRDIESRLQRPSVRYSQLQTTGSTDADCVIIDCYGLLSSIYRYATVAHVGGGFGVGIHNVPEAAVYGVPVMIGPNNKNFQEAQHLLTAGGCHEVADAAGFDSTLTQLLTDTDYRNASGKACADYILQGSGATAAIYRHIAAMMQ